VGKASQMVATELFELLHAIDAEPKSIVFSDSRQDAANQSLEIERLHLRDLRREILVTAARECLAEAQAKYVSQEEREQILDGMKGDMKAMMARMSEWTKMDDELKGIDLNSKKIRLDYLLQYGSRDHALSRITAEFVGLGIHPFDEVGRAKFDDKPQRHVVDEQLGADKRQQSLQSGEKVGPGTAELYRSELQADIEFLTEQRACSTSPGTSSIRRPGTSSRTSSKTSTKPLSSTSSIRSVRANQSRPRSGPAARTWST
jgi:hypothetical protein